MLAPHDIISLCDLNCMQDCSTHVKLVFHMLTNKFGDRLCDVIIRNQ